jgi:hypothetical protein
MDETKMDETKMDETKMDEETSRITPYRRPEPKFTHTGIAVCISGHDPIGAFTDGWLSARISLGRTPVIIMAEETAQYLALLADRVCGGYGFTVEGGRVVSYMRNDIMISDLADELDVRFR